MQTGPEAMPLTCPPSPRHNRMVLRVLCVVFGLATLLCFSGGRVDTALSNSMLSSAPDLTCELAAHSPSAPGQQWTHARHTVVALAGSPWTTVELHAALATSLSPLTVTVFAAIRPEHAPRSALPYLRHTPLLI